MSGTLSPQIVTAGGPRLESSAVAKGRLSRDDGTPVTSGVTGAYTLKRDGVVILNAVAMVDANDTARPGTLKYTIAANLMTRGAYLWTMTLTETLSGLSSTERGRFTLR